jgi:AcrR family transcriptional regulator
MSDVEVPMPTPPGRRPRRAREPRRPLTVDLIVETGIRVLDAEGLDAVTMRRVAQELGTGPASLYAHVASKDELYDLMLDRVSAEIRLPEPDPARWRELIKESALEVRRVLSAHRDIARVSLGAIPLGPNLLLGVERMLAILLAGGVPPKIAAMALDTLAMYIDADVIEGTIYTAKALGPEDGQRMYEDKIGPIRDYFRALPPARYPNIVAMVDDLTEGDGDERFLFGLDIFIRGLASYVPDDS